MEDGLWLRKQYLILARNNGTGVEFWQSQPLASLGLWIKANNAVIDGGEEKDDGQQERV